MWPLEDLLWRVGVLLSNFMLIVCKQLPTHSPSPGWQSSACGQSFPFPDFACVWIKFLSPANSHAAVHSENVPSQSRSAQQHLRSYWLYKQESTEVNQTKNETARIMCICFDEKVENAPKWKFLNFFVKLYGEPRKRFFVRFYRASRRCKGLN